MEKIRTAIIGLGRIAHGYKEYPTHLSALKKDKRFTLVAAADTNAKQRCLFQKKVSPAVAMYVDYRAMLKKEAIDLLVVSVPTDAHFVVCSQAIESGIKNILCEKPVTRTSAEAERLMTLSARRGVKILVNYHRSYSKSYAKLMQLIHKRKWGRALSVSVQYNNGVFNTATHLIHLLEKIFGPIQQVQSEKKDVRNIKDPNISFTASANGLRIFFEGAGNIKYRLLEIDMKFEKGRLRLSNDALSEFKLASGGGFTFLKPGASSVNINMNRSMLDVYENIFQVMKHNRQPHCDIKSAAQTLRVAVKAVESSRSGKLLTV